MIKYMGMNNMWADVNTKPVQGLLFRKFCHEMMGVLVEYDDDVEQRSTHPMMLPKVKIERLTIPEKELLKEITVLAPARQIATTKQVTNRGVTRGSDSKSISPRSGCNGKTRGCVGRE